MAETSIEWTDRVWNCLRGCTEIGAGCRNCYAARMAYRFAGPGKPYEGLVEKRPNGKVVWTGRVRVVPEKLAEPLSWRKPSMVFVNSMSDLFHEDVPEAFIDQVFGVMAKAYWHTFQVLTKRPERMAAYLSKQRGPGNVLTRIIDAAQQHPWPTWKYAEINAGAGWDSFPYSNIWLGTSVENRRSGLPRIDALRGVPASVRFLSIEPLLEDLGEIDLDGIGWVIVGGESGPESRPMHPDWARTIRDQCVAAGVPLFFKQWGEWAVEGQHTPYLMDVAGGKGSHVSRALFPDGHHLPDLTGRGSNGNEATRIFRTGKGDAGRLLDGREWGEFPAASAAHARGEGVVS